MTMTTDLARFQSLMHNVLRVMAGFLWAPHGAQKLLGLLTQSDPADFLTRAWFAGVIEFFGGTLIVLGLFVRPVAFLAAGEMAVAYFISHAPNEFWPIRNRGELAVLYCFLWLYFVAAGAGSFSLDALIRRRREEGRGKREE
ncbi:MAG: DoxX family protein [Gemmatimonadetes bacterium]|nr:DoxX family protein [Gemmatimonadota bacterium]